MIIKRDLKKYIKNSKKIKNKTYLSIHLFVPHNTSIKHWKGDIL